MHVHTELGNMPKRKGKAKKQLKGSLPRIAKVKLHEMLLFQKCDAIKKPKKKFLRIFKKRHSIFGDLYTKILFSLA